MAPRFLVGTLPTVPALPMCRSLMIVLDLRSQHARLAHDRGAAVFLQCRDGHSYEQLPVRQLCEDSGLHCTLSRHEIWA
eukprot:8214222-Prorocentrum_lima.AAC.1